MPPRPRIVFFSDIYQVAPQRLTVPKSIPMRAPERRTLPAA
ncbi:hypothetical protein ACN28I_20670 [Archangium gephyra]